MVDVKGVIIMEQVLILGLDIHGIELAGRITQLAKVAFMGFVATNADKDSYGGFPVYTPDVALSRFPDAGFIPLHVWREARDPFADKWISHVDPTCVISPGAVIGPGCVLYPNAFVGANARLERGVFALSGCIINHDCVVGERAVLTSGVTLAGSVHVGAGAYLGQSATVRQQLRIGKGAFVGMGAVVTKDVPDGQTVAGNPARNFPR